MIRMVLFTTMLLLMIPALSPGEYQWPLDTAASFEGSVQGEVRELPGARGGSLVLDGTSLLKANSSSSLTHGDEGFTVLAWVNPYQINGEQQMIVAKNRYSLNERQWGVMIDRDNRFRLYVWQGTWATAQSSRPPKLGSWHLLGIVIRPTMAQLWVNGEMKEQIPLTKPIPSTEAPLTFGGVDDNGRIWQNLVGAIDHIQLFEGPLSREKMKSLYTAVTSTHKVPAPTPPYPLWTGAEIPTDITEIPFVPNVVHRTIHQAGMDTDKFLHGAAIVFHKGLFYANWANSPVNENGPHETLKGRRSTDGGKTWPILETIGPGFHGEERHSHGILFVHQGELWTICSRFGVGTPGRRFPGLQAEAFVLAPDTDRWLSRGIVMENCWPYDEPVRMANGNFITGGQDKDGLPVVAISRGNDVTQWETISIPYNRRLKPSFAETTVWSEGERVLAIIRGGNGIAWVSVSGDNGRTWSKARASNFPMPRAKAYLGKLSTGQLYLLSNLKNRDTLAISVSKSGENSLSSIWRVRHGKTVAPRFPGRAKGKEWSYPYGYEHDGHLFVVYSVGKEDCGLSVIPIKSLQPTGASKPPH